MNGAERLKGYQKCHHNSIGSDLVLRPAFDQHIFSGKFSWKISVHTSVTMNEPVADSRSA